MTRGLADNLALPIIGPITGPIIGRRGRGGAGGI
jgi:hypothetical protein